MKKHYLLLFVFLTLFSLQMEAQNRVLGRPDIFRRPLDESDFYLSKTDKKSPAAWRVICDRSEDNLTKTYARPDGSAAFSKLKYREDYYVTEESGDWLHLVKADVDGNLRITSREVDYGWVDKKNVLLWNSSLIDPKTDIHRKGFLLNKADDTRNIIRLEKKEIVKIYDGPYSGTSNKTKTIYDFYFVYKKEGNRYLLCEEVEISYGSSARRSLIGWVDNSRVQDWNTRLALEPNFQPRAFTERKNNPDLRVVAYGEETAAKEHFLTGNITNSAVFWDSDPAILDKELLAESNPRRFKGGVIRFPVFSKFPSYYRSGVIGEVTVKTINSELSSMGELNLAAIEQNVRAREAARDNYNVLFVVEATRSMLPFKLGITEAMKKIKRELANVPNVKFAASLYRDIPERQYGGLLEVKELDNNINNIVSFIEAAEFNAAHDFDDYTALNYSLQQTLLEAGIKGNETNIVYLIGNFGDYSADATRKATANSNGDETLVSILDVSERLAQMNVNLITVQCENNNTRESSKFVSAGRTMMLEAANQQHSLYRGVSDFVRDANLKNPSVKEGNDIELIDGPVYGKVIKPIRGYALDEEILILSMSNAARATYDFTEKFWEIINRVVDDGVALDDISPGVLRAPVAKLIFDLEDEKSKRKEWSREDLSKLAKNKYKLYTEVFIPVKNPKSSMSPVSPVLFMPQSDLEQYVSRMEALELSLMGEPSKQRDGLQNALISLLIQLTGNDDINPKDYSIDDLRALMQGVSKDGLPETDDTDERIDFMIENIQSRRQMPDEKIKRYIEGLSKKTVKLSEILRLGKRYDFSFVSGRKADGSENVYFWIPLEYVF
ncbi:MAG: hypothetical protein ACI85O_002776 [Saprospiraceae bacterium]|jgi:hypothetical protein